MATIIKGKNPRKPHTVRFQDSGKQRERSFATAGEAKAFKARFEHDSRAQIFVDPKRGNTPFAEYAAQWIEQRPLAPNSKRAYVGALRTWLAPAFAGMTLAQVAQDREGATTLLTSTMLKGTSGRKPVGAGSVCKVRGLLLGVMDEAVKAGRIPSHRLADIEIRAYEKPETEFLFATKEQLAAVASGLRADWQLSVRIMLGCGLRISEVLAVKLSDFTAAGRVLRVRRQVTPDGQVSRLKHRKTSDYRDVPVPVWLWKRVQAHVAAHGTDDGYLFGNDGQRVRYSTYQPMFARASVKAGLTGYGPHQLRHSFASALLTDNVPISDVAKFLGHKNVNVTVAIYGHLTPSAFDRSRDVLESQEI